MSCSQSYVLCAVCLYVQEMCNTTAKVIAITHCCISD